MPTIQTLIDRYGQPPPEVALDWAWQIRRALNHSSHTFRTSNGCASFGLDDVVSPDDTYLRHPTPCLLEVSCWTDWQLDDEGRLHCEGLNYETARVALADLKAWISGVDTRTLATDNSAIDSIAIDSMPSDEEPSGEEPIGPGRLKVVEIDDAQDRQARIIGESVDTNAGMSPVRVSVKRRASSKLGPKSICGLALGAGIMLAVAVWFMGSQAPGRSEDLSSISQSESTSLHAAEHTDAAAVVSSDRKIESDALSIGSFESSGIKAKELAVDTLLPVAERSALDQLSLDSSLTSPDSSITKEPRDSLTDSSSAEITSALEASQPSTAALSAPTDPAAAEPTDVVAEVQKATKQAEKAQRVADVATSRDWVPGAHGEPWILNREIMRYRITLPAKLHINDESCEWTLALEPIAGLTLEPQRPVTLRSQGLVIWRIFDSAAKAPRANLVVRALHGRDGRLDLVFCGTAEDFPTLSIPLSQRILTPLSVQVQTQAVQLRGALAGLSSTIITPDQVAAATQRKQMLMGQIQVSTRLGAVLPEVNRLTDLVDGQLTMHAILKNGPTEQPVATWGRITP